VRIISRLRHRNLVQLLGWCDSPKKGLLLVYELVPQGSLDKHIHDNPRLLTWSERYKIILGLGSALRYLHLDWEQCVVHGDIKPNNIMLDSSYNTKLGDFGLARLVDHGSDPKTTALLQGTMGYVDPDFLNTSRRSTQSDVYSFGEPAGPVVLRAAQVGVEPLQPGRHGRRRRPTVEAVRRRRGAADGARPGRGALVRASRPGGAPLRRAGHARAAVGGREPARAPGGHVQRRGGTTGLRRGRERRLRQLLIQRRRLLSGDRHKDIFVGIALANYSFDVSFRHLLVTTIRRVD